MVIMVVLLLAAGLVMLAFLVLVLTIHVSRSKRLGSNTHSTINPREARTGISRRGSSSCETCHMCGGLRLRSPNAPLLDDANSSQLHTPLQFAVSDHIPHVRSKPPREHWAEMKAQVSMSIKQVVQKLLTHKRKQTKGETLRRLKNLVNFSWGKACTESKASGIVPTCVSIDECSSFSSADVCTEGSIVSEVVRNAAKSDSALSSPCASLHMPSSEANSNPARFDVVKAQGPQGTADSDTNVAAIHRLILEILVSPSGSHGCRSQSSCSTSASALTLKLETNAALGHLADCAEALKSKANKCHLSQDTCLPRDTLSKVSGTLYTFEHQTSQILDEAVLVPDAWVHCPSEKLKSLGDTLLDTEVTRREGCAGSPIPESEDCGQICHRSHDNMEGISLKGIASHGATGKHSIVTDRLKFRIGNHACKKVVSDAAPKSTAEVKKSLVGSEMASVGPLSGLGSVRITLLKSDAQEESAEKTNSQVGSPLASLNVAGKPIGGSGLSNQKKEKVSTKARVFSETISSHSPESSARVGQGISSVCEQYQMEGEDHSSLQALTDASSNEDFGSSSKKERRKKKSKGKKLKLKTGALMADTQEMHEIGKIALEAVKQVSPVSEREIGCVCGAPKGDLHNETCPYPFTSSGSMLQRKIKGQYNDLVRSNASKTLTLAQVGQFTSCLVEAKSTLQQKSESIQRKFTITKSLLSKADKSSFDRLCGQIYGLEMEQKKLEEDTVVYNRLQEQLKLSPAYKKMLEYGRAHFEVQPHTGQMIEKLEPEDPEISFEELLAQEKKDGFWQRHSLARSAVSAS